MLHKWGLRCTLERRKSHSWTLWNNLWLTPIPFCLFLMMECESTFYFWVAWNLLERGILTGQSCKYFLVIMSWTMCLHCCLGLSGSMYTISVCRVLARSWSTHMCLCGYQGRWCYCKSFGVVVFLCLGCHSQMRCNTSWEAVLVWDMQVIVGLGLFQWHIWLYEHGVVCWEVSLYPAVCHLLLVWL